MVKKIIDLDVDGSVFLECFLQEEGDAPAVIICPGGAYLTLSEHEGCSIANRFYKEGFSAFILNYSIGSSCRMPKPLLELSTAVITVRECAKELHVDPNKVMVCGFSAGGHLCALLATRYMLAARLLGRDPKIVRPDVVILGYPMTTLLQSGMPVEAEVYSDEQGEVLPQFRCAIVKRQGKKWIDFNPIIWKNLIGNDRPTDKQKMMWSPLHHINERMPPVFIWTTRTDEIVSYIQSEQFAEKLMEHNVPVKYHLFMKGRHGLGLPDFSGESGSECSSWFAMMKSWLDELIL